MKKFLRKIKKKLFYNNELDNMINTLNNEINTKLDNVLNVLNNVTLLNSNNIELTKNIYPYLKFKNVEMLSLEKEKNNKVRVLLCGFYGAPNLGDELMLQTILEKLPKDIELTIMLSENIDFDITDYPPSNFIHYPKNMMDINDLAQYFDVIIFGGGALIDDYIYPGQQYQMPLGYILINLSKRAIQYNKKVILYGLSCNDKFEYDDYLQKLEFVINNCSYVSFRDTNSIESLKRHFDVSKINLVDDLIFANSMLKKEKILEYSNVDNYINVGIIMICNEDNYHLIKKILKKLLQNKKIKITLIPFYSYCNNDANIYNRVIKEINSNRIELFNETINFKKLIDIVDKQKYIISMRYHGSLLALLRGKTVLSIIYDVHRHYKNKMNYIYDCYGFKKHTLNISDINDNKLDDAIKELLSSNDTNIISTNVYSTAAKTLDNVLKKYIGGNNDKKN